MIFNYFHRYKYYLKIRAHLKNNYENLEDAYELDTFMLRANQFVQLSRQSNEELHSKYKNKRHKYSQGLILTTLVTFEDEILKESVSSSITTPFKNFMPQRTGTKSPSYVHMCILKYRSDSYISSYSLHMLSSLTHGRLIHPQCVNG